MNEDDFVWYASYGSNSYKDRFYCYIKGGQPFGSSKEYPGCRDKTLPLAEKNIIIPHELYFAKHSRSWKNGGVAFIRTERNKDVITYGRMYLVTKEQFADIVSQETNRDQNLTIDFELVKDKGQHEILDKSWYGSIIYLGIESKSQIFTITNSTNLNEINKPSKEYLTTILKGIISNFTLKETQLVNYLISRPGIYAYYSEEEIKTIVRELI